MSIFLGLVSVAATVAVAFFTHKLTAATEKMVELQRTLGEKQEQLAELQRTLAEAEIRPLLVFKISNYTPSTDSGADAFVSSAFFPTTLGIGDLFGASKLLVRTASALLQPKRVSLTFENLGKFGVFVIGLRKHDQKPAVPGAHGTWVADASPLPIPVHAGSGVEDNIVLPEPKPMDFLEVIYQDGASGAFLSDLWQVTNDKLDLKRVWHAKHVQNLEG